jgi:hypothetical protein
LALRVSVRAAQSKLKTARALTRELPLTMGLLAAGKISARHAELIAERTWSLDPELVGAFEAAVLEKAPEQTVKQLQDRRLDHPHRPHPHQSSPREMDPPPRQDHTRTPETGNLAGHPGSGRHRVRQPPPPLANRTRPRRAGRRSKSNHQRPQGTNCDDPSPPPPTSPPRQPPPTTTPTTRNTKPTPAAGAAPSAGRQDQMRTHERVEERAERGPALRNVKNASPVSERRSSRSPPTNRKPNALHPPAGPRAAHPQKPQAATN